MGVRPPRSRTISAKRVLQPAVLLSRAARQVVLALKVLVEGGFADADVGQHLVEPDAAETVPIEAPNCRRGQFFGALPIRLADFPLESDS